jgi:hypothetical protein
MKEDKDPRSIEIGDRVTVLFATETITGKLLSVMSGEGETDGILVIEVESFGGRELVPPTAMWVYERHIQLLFKAPALDEDGEEAAA